MDLAYPGQIAMFKVFPDRKHSPCYWEVLVFANRHFMRKAFQQLDPDDTNDRFGAIVIPQVYMKYVRGRWHTMKNSLGLVLLARNQLGAGTQCHESLHMALNYLRHVRKFPRLNRKGTDAHEEDLAYHVGRCARLLNDNLYRFNCYGDKYADS